MKKYRYKHRLFIVEGVKMVNEALASKWKIDSVILNEAQIEKFEPKWLHSLKPEISLTDPERFQSLNSLQSPEGILAVIELPDTFETHFLTHSSAYVLENIQDPGNLGTIIRTADWFGINQIICSQGTVDALNPKVLRACMGGIFRVSLHYLNSEDFYQFLTEESHRLMVGHMEGIPIQKITLPENPLIVLGNEANGVSSQLLEMETAKKICIQGAGQAESLNVSVAAGIMGYHAYIGGGAL